MNKFMALIKKDYYIGKKQLLLPIWILAGFYAMMVLFSIYPLISGKFYWNSMFNVHTDEVDKLSPMINYMVNFVSIISSGLLSLLATITIAQSALNEDFRRNYELFHRTQPISIWLKSLSKFTVAIVGGWVVFFIISSVNFIIINGAFIFWHQFVPNMAFSALIQGLIVYMKAILVIGSLTFFASALFKDKAFLTGISVLLAIQVFLIIVNSFFKMHIPLPFSLIGKLLFISEKTKIEPSSTLGELNKLVHANWKLVLWNMQTIYQIVVSAILFVISTIIYKSKEIKI